MKNNIQYIANKSNEKITKNYIKPVLEINQIESFKKNNEVNNNSKESIIPKTQDLHPKNMFSKS